MRHAALVVLTLGTVFAAPASAQTYGSNSPVCLQGFGRLSEMDCSYTSIEQCRPSAGARAAQCIVNPYYVAQAARPQVRHRHRGAY